MDQSERELLERGVRAIERLAEDPVIQVETKPPICPHCETMNPNVRVQEHEADGRLAEFVIQAECLKCHKLFLAMPMQWEVVKTVEDARQLVNERNAQRGFDQG
jgi:hypothetical protein